jgi:hypothetical protein
MEKSVIPFLFDEADGFNALGLAWLKKSLSMD